MDPDTFPRQHARTLRFTLGAPRSFTVPPDGARVVFLRSRSGAARANQLWVLDLGGGAGGPVAERMVADTDDLLGGVAEELSAEERARRERTREGAAGIVGYATDRDATLAAFSLGGRLFTADLLDGTATELHVPTPVVDPRPAPDGQHVAYVCGGALRVVRADGSDDRALATPECAEVSYGLAEFIAAEEMDRTRGFWWSPDGDGLLVARVDNAPVRQWWIADPAHPDTPPVPVRYPAAGTPNADVTLAFVDLTGGRVAVGWDREAYPYLARVHWSPGHPPIVLVQSRDQRSQAVLTVDVSSGRTAMRHAEEDPRWLDLFAGVPALTPDGRLVQIADRDDTRVLTVGGEPVTGPESHVRSVLDVADDSVLLTASAGADAHGAEIGEVHVYRVGGGVVERVTAAPGVHTAVRGGSVVVLSSSNPASAGQSVRVLRDGAPVAEIPSYAEQPVLTARPEFVLADPREIPCAVFLPADYTRADGPLPVLMDPYAGPHGQRVLAAQNPHLTSQWLADQGFAVVVADGRGTPGRRPSWEKAVFRDLAGPVLEDQVDALRSLADRYLLDLRRVAIRGWSFGGYLAALAVLRRPDVFHAAVVGAPVTDLRLYDTHYQERYLGRPDESPEVYAANSLIDDAGLVQAAEPARPMMVIHGLADDNVVVAHSLRLSSALLAAGRPHEVLPLSGVTHMTPQEQVAENLLLLQVDFLKRSLGLPR
jgi:dipeptidyl-peptidase-4